MESLKSTLLASKKHRPEDMRGMGTWTGLFYTGGTCLWRFCRVASMHSSAFPISAITYHIEYHSRHYLSVALDELDRCCA